MPTIILVPAIMGITIGSVAGVRAIYHAIHKDGENADAKKWDVEEFTANLRK